MNNLNNLKNKWGIAQRVIGIILYLVSAGMLVFSTYLCFSPDIWYDELYSIQFALKSVSEMVKLTAADVHPPLYYVIVHYLIRGFGYIGGALGVTTGTDTFAGNMPVIYAKMASVIPLVILFIYAVTIIRKRYGTLIGGLFSCAMIAMPQMADYSVEIRMYSWVMLFVTAMCIHAEPFFENDKDKQIRGLKWSKAFPVFIYGLLACYTQYYAAVAVAFVYLFLIVWSVRKNIYQLGILLISANFTAVAYFPWIGVVLSQAKSVSSNYWIQPLSLRSFGGIIKYLMKPGFFNEKLATILAVVMFILVAFAVVINIRDAYMWLCFMPVIGIIAFGFAASILLRPVFTYRYMIPGMAALWLGVLIGAGRLLNVFGKDAGTDEKKAKPFEKALFAGGLLLTSLVIVFCIRDYWAFRGNELYKRVNMVETEKFWNSINAETFGEKTILVCNFDQVSAISLYYANGMRDVVGEQGEEPPVMVYLYGAMTDEVLANTFPGILSVTEPWEVWELVDSGSRVLFLGSFNSREDIIKEWEESPRPLSSENKGSYLLERYWFDVFEVTKK
jgi:hypothetical protein